ncbi:hypothetical protein R5R35_013177 [Gryllus longicercus]|uniref:Uncharacterized protein n=1 Tax=Gryllus longicercus TaxID=2509291 RepID=A0AAN9VB38_9ORTH
MDNRNLRREFKHTLAEIDDKIDDPRSRISRSVAQWLRTRLDTLMDIFTAMEMERNEYANTEKTISTIEEIIKSENNKIETLLEKTEQKLNLSAPLAEPQETTYTQAVKKGTHVIMKYPHRTKIILPTRDVKASMTVQSINNVKDAVETKRAFEEEMSKFEDKINIKQMRLLRNKGLAIEAATPQEAIKIKEIFQNSHTCKINIPNPKLPKVVIFNVPKDKLEEDVIQDIYDRNFSKVIDAEDYKESIKVLYRIGSKSEHYVLETKPQLWHEFMNRRKIYLFYKSTGVEEYCTPTRCRKCLRYGHTYSICREELQFCGYCAQTGHDVNHCPNKEQMPKCINCIRKRLKDNEIAHDANDKNCFAFHQAKLIEKSLTDYGEISNTV